MLKQIKERAKQQKISVREIERRANVSENSIYRWDDAPPSIDKVKRVADVLECKVDDLIADPATEDTGAAMPAC